MAARKILSVIAGRKAEGRLRTLVPAIHVFAAAVPLGQSRMPGARFIAGPG
jgi:hypothetical protein